MAPRPPKPPGPPDLKERLDALRAEWSGRRLDSDPLCFPHRYGDPADREVVAFLSASLAFGRVASIKASLERLLAALGPHPAAFLDRWDGEAPIPGLERFVHRWVTGKDVEDLLRRVRGARQRHGSLGELFARGDGAADADYVGALSSFLSNLRSLSSFPAPFSRGLSFLLPSPSSTSALKRQHLFLRWMIRSEGFDLGLWRGGGFSPARLLLPMDTHVHRISRYLGLTRRRSADLAASREATAFLRRLDPRDPVSYDWALSRLGILAECSGLPARRHCGRCAIASVCHDRVGPPGPRSEERALTA
ncbi:MAG TPA: TIGR02757 family protein [Thermoanaerobaculia bacterium]|nr:TIGR02757 family protein [Thermoanaerobaculia bacterium]